MNDNQYIAHSGVICHYGVKGMRKGQHIMAGKNVQKVVSTWVDNNITGKTAKREAQLADQRVARKNAEAKRADTAAYRANQTADVYRNGIRAANGQNTQDEINRISNLNDNAIRQANHYSNVANREQKQANRKRTEAAITQRKADDAHSRYNKTLFGRAENAYNVVRTKSQQIFGKPTRIKVIRSR